MFKKLLPAAKQSTAVKKRQQEAPRSPDLFSAIFLLDPKKTEQEKHQNQGGGQLAPDFFLA
jgi:hypothetical protein